MIRTTTESEQREQIRPRLLVLVRWKHKKDDHIILLGQLKNRFQTKFDIIIEATGNATKLRRFHKLERYTITDDDELRQNWLAKGAKEQDVLLGSCHKGKF